MGPPIFFRQERAGLHGQPFMLLKFRTMRNLRDASEPDEARITPFGAFLRNTSLDELPELLNVLKGDMSLVGPRPLLVRYLDRYTPAQARRHEVMPGITGWSQVRGRNQISWEKKFELDVWYVNNANLWLDLRILGLTILTVLRQEGVQTSAGTTAPEFEGIPRKDTKKST